MYFDDEVDVSSQLDALSELSIGEQEAPEQEAAPPAETPEVEAAVPASTDPLDDAGWSLDNLIKDLDAQVNPAPADALPEAVQAEAPTDDALSVLQQYGGVEGAVETLGIVNGLVEATPEGVTGFLQTLFDQAQPAYAQLVDQVIQYNPEYAISQLQAAGHLPVDLATAPTAVIGKSIEPEVFDSIPENLRDTALRLPDEVQEELNLMSEAMRNQMLTEKKELAEMRAFQQQQMEQARQAQYQEAWDTGQKQRDELVNQMETAHLNVLSKWQPFGPDASEQNQFLYESLMEGAMRSVLQDPKFATMYSDFNNLLAQAPLKALEGNKMAANQMAQQARGLAAQFNAQYARVLQTRVAALDPVFRGYRGSQSTQSAQPARKEIRGSVISDGQKVNARGPDGKATDDFLKTLAATITTQ